MARLVACLRGEAEPLVSGMEGLKSLALAKAAEKSNALRAWVSLSD